MQRKHKQHYYRGLHSIPHHAFGGIIASNDLPGKVKSFLSSHGDEVITSIEVCREPINDKVMSAMNLISFGALEAAKQKQGVDSFFHLYLFINGKYILEKNQLLDFRTGTPGKNSQKLTINFDKSKGLTIQQMVDNCINKMGMSNFTTYNAFSLNCQSFVSNMLSANGIIPPHKFIDANMKFILSNIPGYVPKIAQLITDTAAAFDYLRQKIPGLKNL